MRILVDVVCATCGSVEEELVHRDETPPPCSCGGARKRSFGRARLGGVSPTSEVRLSDGTVVTTNEQMRRWQAENPTARQVHPGTAEDRRIRERLEAATQARADRRGIGVGAMKDDNRRAFIRRQEEKR